MALQIRECMALGEDGGQWIEHIGYKVEMAYKSYSNSIHRVVLPRLIFF